MVVQTARETSGQHSYALLVLDSETGDELDSIRMCDFVSVFAADSDHYFALGLIGSHSVGLARFPM